MTTATNAEPTTCPTCKAENGDCLCNAWSEHFDEMIEPISIHDPDFRIVRANQAFGDLLGMKPEEVVGCRCHELIHKLPNACKNCPHQRLLAENRAVAAEMKEEVLGCIIYVNTSPIRNSSGKVIGSVHVVHDMTDHYAAENERIEREKLQTALEMAGAVSHELNQPLQVISGYAEMLARNIPEQDANHRRAVEIKTQAMRMRDTIRKMKKIRKYETRDYIDGTRITDFTSEAN